MFHALIAAEIADSQSRPKPPINSVSDYFIYNVVSNTALVISITILLVGLVALVLQFRLFRAGAVQPYDILRISAVTLIITFSLALAAFLDDESLKAASPIFGLFSTIAGYLLGSAQRGSNTRVPENRADAESGKQAGR